MALTTPPTDMKHDITPTDPKKVMAKAEAKAGAGYYMVPPHELDVMADFNVRVRSTGQWEESVKALMDSIRANGFMSDKPIAVVADTDGEESRLWVVDGHTRLEAVLRLINEGVSIETVPVVVKPKSTNFEDMLVSLVTSNSGKPLSVYETSLVVKRLVGYGWAVPAIAEKLGYSTKQIDNMVVLSGAPAKIRNQVVAGKLSATEAVSLIRKHGGKAVEIAEAAEAEAKKAGKKKVTAKSVKAAAKAAAPNPEPPTAEAGPASAISYALDVAADGLAWLRLWRDGDADARAELDAWADPNGGL